MIVNMLRAEGVNPEYIIRRSFHQFQSERAYPEFKSKLRVLREKLNSLQLTNEDGIREVISLQSQLTKYNEEITRIINQPENLVPFLVPGRLIKVKGFGWGICVNVSKKNFELEIKKIKNKSDALNIINTLNGQKNQVEMYFIDVLLYVKNNIDSDSKLLPGNVESSDGQMGVVPIIINSVENISQIKVNIPRDLKDKKELKKAENFYIEVLRRFPEIPLMDPIKDMEIQSEKLEENLEKISHVKETLKRLKHFTQVRDLLELKG